MAEALLARTRPRHLLVGKIAGIGLFALAQLSLIGAVALDALRLVPERPGPLPDPDERVAEIVRVDTDGQELHRHEPTQPDLTGQRGHEAHRGTYRL